MKTIFVFLLSVLSVSTLTTSKTLAAENPFQVYLGEYDVTETSRCIYDHAPTNNCLVAGVGVRPDGENGIIYIYEIDAQGNSIGYPLYERFYEDELGREEVKIDRPSGVIARWTRSVSLVNGDIIFESRAFMKNDAGDVVYRYASRQTPMFGDEHTVERVFQLRRTSN